MLDAQEAAYGDGLDPEHRHEYMWAVKPHYFTPFYNWPYTFGLLFGIGLYAQYVDDPDRFRAGYDDLLSTVGMADAVTLGEPVRHRRARRAILGREPRRARSATSTTTSAWPVPSRFTGRFVGSPRRGTLPADRFADGGMTTCPAEGGGRTRASSPCFFEGTPACPPLHPLGDA